MRARMSGGQTADRPVLTDPGRHDGRRSLIVCADDFGLDPAVNEAVEIAYRDGVLTTASLMVGGDAAADAVARARRLPGLRIGLHLVLVDGRPLSPRHQVAGLVGDDGAFEPDMARAAVGLFFDPRRRRQLAREIRAQFAAFAATGLRLDHVNAHKHFHLHPTIARLVLEIGRDYGMTGLRIPDEPVAPLRRAFPAERIRAPVYRPWITALRRRARRAGLWTSDHVFGLAWSGGMVEERVLRLLPCLPPGVSELYLHPSAAPLAMVPGRHTEELAALVSPRVRARLAELGIALVGYGSPAGSGARTRSG